MRIEERRTKMVSENIVLTKVINKNLKNVDSVTEN